MKTETFKKLLDFVIQTTNSKEDIKNNLNELVDIFESEIKQPIASTNPHISLNPPSPHLFSIPCGQSVGVTVSNPSSQYITYTLNKYNEEK